MSKNDQLAMSYYDEGTRQPLAERMRPRTLEEIVGQESAVGPDSPFGKILRSEDVQIPSVVLWGPPGTGKTSIAQVTANSRKCEFMKLSGVLDGVKELREVIEQAEATWQTQGKPSVVLVDEIHRFNKAQQDAFLPHVESGRIVVVGQTTENVSFRLRNALLSRLRVIRLEQLSVESIEQLVIRALTDADRGLGKCGLTLEVDASRLLAELGGGDARRSLTALEWSAHYVRASGRKSISEADVTEAFGAQPRRFDQSGDYHYDVISAFIKSMRGSDPDAALYYMLSALEGGEEPEFICRRMVIFASEDAVCDPRALEIALLVTAGVEQVGMPEGRILMSQAVTYLASCPKSNASYKALREMEQIVRENPALEVPLRLRNAPTELMKDMGQGAEYHYPHDFPDAFFPEHYLPEELKGIRVYHPSDRGVEAKIKARLSELRRRVDEAD